MSGCYHSAYNTRQADRLLLGCGVWPLRSKVAGPCPLMDDQPDIVDESLEMFKANIMFRNFKPEGPGDLVHIYLLLFIHQVSHSTANIRVNSLTCCFGSHCFSFAWPCSYVYASCPPLHQALGKLEKAANKAEGQRILSSLGGEAPACPGDSNFPISVIYPPAENPADKKEFGKMLTQLRKEVCLRLPDLVFPDANAPGTKWWLGFGKRKFLNKPL